MRNNLDPSNPLMVLYLNHNRAVRGQLDDAVAQVAPQMLGRDYGFQLIKTSDDRDAEHRAVFSSGHLPVRALQELYPSVKGL